MHLQHFNQQFILSETGALFWIEQKMLIIADAHLAKENHFRKNGIAVPRGILQFDLQKIETLIDTFQPSIILFLGDMFHSEENEGLNEFLYWRKKISGLKIKLVIGNHDILNRDWYIFAGIDCYDDALQVENILFTHDKKITEKETLNLYGHIHPCVMLHGKAKQSLRLPCFWFYENYGVIPAFGRFTGSRSIEHKKNDLVFGIGDGKIFNILPPVRELRISK
ncbi:MAG: ligase-associated DNA damage response endonuclease PdeM [Chitinophagales bacterium]